MNLSHSDKPLELFVFLEAAEEFVNKKGLDRATTHPLATRRDV